MELAMVTVFASPIVKSLITEVLSYCSKEIALVWGVKGKLEKLARTLELIDAVLQDAEMQQGKRNLLVIWLGELKDVAHDAEDILDELQYQDLRCKIKNESNVLRCLLPSNPLGFGYKISGKIKDVNKRLDAITKDMKSFNFINQSGSSGSNTVVNGNIPEASSHINDSAAVVGRNDDVSRIRDLLMDSYSVVRITGMGGIGKTTLAQLVYATADHFPIKLWVSVSRKSDVREIFGDLLESNEERKSSREVSSMEVIKNRLKEKLTVGKCLIVLDDVWINNGIDVELLLKDLLSMSCQGSKILMPMRSAEDIPPLTDCRYKIYQLHVLSDDDCWSMIKKTAFGHGGAKETTYLINIGKQIATKCGGLPLAARTLGGLLYSRKNEEEWLSILSSPIWSLPTESKIIFILKLSYDHLSPHVKQCFSYCSMFPKGHTFRKKELILMWMAEGFLNSRWQPNASPETVGKEYIETLLLNSFFQNEDRKLRSFGDPNKVCRMHDLVHDLAISVAGSEYRLVKMPADADPEVTEQSNKFRRLGLHFLHSNVSELPPAIYKASKVRTSVSFYPDNLVFCYLQNENIFGFSLLRVIKLSYAAIKELPQSICTLKHLRYLDLSFTEISTFPSSFSQLYSLQTLRLKECRLEELPNDMAKLISLEYFSHSTDDGGSFKFSKMPRELSRLSKLKKLSIFVVGIGKGYGIEELKDLNLLGGKLTIQNLDRVTDAGQANLMGKKKLAHIVLDWGLGNRSNIQDNEVIKDNEVINDLQPHPNLRKLQISNFAGSKFPTWLMTVKQIGNEFYRSNEEASCTAESSFPSLLELHLGGLYNLEEWLEDQRSSTSSFASLEKVDIFGCPELSTTPTKFPSLKKLDFEIKLESSPITSLPLKLLRGAKNVLQTLVVVDCREFVGFIPDAEVEQQHYQPDDLSNDFLSKIEIMFCPCLTKLPADFRGLNSLTYLTIKDCVSLRSLPDGIQYLPALQTLIIGGFSDELESFPFPAATGAEGERYFISLRELEIHGRFCLGDVLPGQIQHLTSLQHLKIAYWDDLFSLPEWLGKLSSLQTLEIEECEELSYLPSEEQWEQLTSLQILDISGCPPLIERCRAGNEESHKIAPFILTKDSPSHSKYERMGDIPSMKSRKGKEKL